MPANYYSANVQYVGSTAAPTNLPLVKRITAVKYFPGTNSSAAILSGSGNSTGNQLWFENAVSGANIVDLLSIYSPNGVTVSLGGGAQILIYGTVSPGSV